VESLFAASLHISDFVQTQNEAKILTSCDFTLMVIFNHQRVDLEVESRTRRTRSSPFNMQGANQPKSTGPSSLGDANFYC
jgi:hypothetical protein